MVARTPPKQRKMVAPLNPVLLRETVKKVERCMARLQELQYTVAGGNKVIDGVSLSPRSTRGYLRTSLRCKQESLRTKSTAPKKSPVGKLPATSIGEWRRMSLPAMLVGETVGEILQASQFAREIVAAVACKTKKSTLEDPKTPVTQQRKQRPHPEDTELKSRRKKEKQTKLQSIRSESDSPCLLRARSRINFKVSPPKKSEVDKENARYLANRVSPRNRPWAKKTVLFPNPLFLSTDSTQQQKFCKTRSPVIARNKKQTTPHKFLIKSPPSGSKFQVKIKNPPVVCSLSPTRPTNLSRKSPTRPTNLSRKSPTRPTNLSRKSPKLSTASKLRRSFSPSRLANKLVSPLKGRKILLKSDGLVMSGLKQRPIATPRRFSLGRI
ncbi:microtubule-binding protein TANGLED-like isoform X1 [Populus nigra]|uniref:microtubule-binding protein TANGLED-like isoform X1 n=1 Tax=Populus nigra TaxID=3691 RepID=UPI002B276391|nr:microtubule-binding protein TANGLED-like isoform X1 [Populus nigra]